MAIRYETRVFDASKDGVAKAQALIKASEGHIRSSSPAQVDKMKAIILTGKWRPKASSNAVITDSGIVKEGIHRLRAFIKAAEIDPKVRIEWDFKIGVPDAEAHAIQTDVAHHTMQHILQANGLDGEHGPVVKFIANRGSSTQMERSKTADDFIALARAFHPVIVLIKSRLTGKKIATGEVIAAICRGYRFYVTEAKAGKRQAETDILRFCAILSGNEGATQPHERYPFALNQYFKDGDGRRNKEETHRAYQLTELALAAFIERRTPILGGSKQAVLDLRPINREQFPLYGEPPLPSKMDLNPAFIIPVGARGPIGSERVLQEVFANGVIDIPATVAWRPIAKNAVVGIYSSVDKRLVGTAVFKKVSMDNGHAKVTLGDIVRKDANVSMGKLIQISRPKHSISHQKLGAEITKLTCADVAFLAN